MYRFAIVVCLTLLLWLTTLCLADIPKLINYQGMLTNNSGQPLIGNYDINFKVYNASSGGDMRWEETQTDIAVTNGLFNVILGGATVGGMDLDFSEEYWLEIWVEGEQMSERLRFTSVGYAYRAKVADSATVATSAQMGGGWVDDGTVVRLQNSSDTVGIGTSSPGRKLHVYNQTSFEVRAESGEGYSFFETYAAFDYNSGLKMIEDGSTKAYAYWNAAEDFLSLFESGVDRLVVKNGNVGVATTSPSSRLHVGGSMALAYRHVSWDHNATGSDCIIAVNASSGARWIYLPSAVGIVGRVYIIKKVDSSSYAVFVEATSSQEIDGSFYAALRSQWNYLTVVSDGSNWLITGKSL
jgi:hypothetical protein